MAKLKQSTKKDTLEKDELQSLAQRLWTQVAQDPRRAVAVAGGAVAAVLAVLLVLYLLERSEQKRLASVGAVVGRYLALEGDSPERPALRGEMEGLAEKYGGSKEGGLVLYYLAGLRADEGDYQGAVEAYTKVRERHGDDATLSSAAALGLAYTYRNMGENGKAMEVFSKILETEGVPTARTLVEFEIGRLHEEGGDRDKAEEIYRRLAEQDPDGAVGAQARRRLDRLVNG